MLQNNMAWMSLLQKFTRNSSFIFQLFLHSSSDSSTTLFLLVCLLKPAQLLIKSRLLILKVLLNYRVDRTGRFGTLFKPCDFFFRPALDGVVVSMFPIKHTSFSWSLDGSSASTTFSSLTDLVVLCFLGGFVGVTSSSAFSSWISAHISSSSMGSYFNNYKTPKILISSS